MGKYKRYKNRIEMFLSSEKGRRILNFCYSWGAAVVIIGALFKLLHLPYANQIMFISMTTEAFIFFILGFDRPGSDYNWEDVFPVLKSKNPLDRPDFASGGGSSGGIVGGSGAIIVGDGAANVGGAGGGGGVGGANLGGGTVVIGNFGGGGGGNFGSGVGGGGVIGVGGGIGEGGGIATGMSAEGGVANQPPKPSPQALVNAGMATMGLNISETDSEALAESIKKLSGAAEQISKMADLTEATQSYIEQISQVSQDLEKFSLITGSLGEVSDSLINSCKLISGSNEEGALEKPKSYVAQMTQLNDNISGLNQFYETQLTGLRSQMETIHQINAGLNRIRDLYDSSIVDSSAFRNENERMAQLLSQLNHVYSRLLQAMTVNMQASGYQTAAPGYQQPPYQGGGYR
ncbi:MAG: gliding motility protein GldL [Tannerella sp.]|jgi:hypothetical protein|nr:gliding motility protein GldL [Tannerella sp.]